jgi:gliding-associated putative ABC transporter substrate-binding component GldG
MHAIWTIARRELDSFFDSLIAYILLVLFLGFSGFFTWLLGMDIFLVGQASLESFFNVAFWTLFLFIPALTMRLLAEERKTGTLELLLTKAVTDRELVLGKFLSALILVAAALAFTAPYVITIANIGNIDAGQVLCGYLGLLLMSAMYIAIGLYTSSITSNQVVAFLAALFIGLFFHIIFGIIANQFTGWMAEIFQALSVNTHIESISRGVLDSRDLIYFISIACIGIFLAEMSLVKRNTPSSSTTWLIVAIAVVVNLVADQYYFRIDLTEDRQYTLSKATRDILKGLDEPVTVKAYFSKDLPPNIVKTRKDFQDLLIEYANISDDQVIYSFVDPNEEENYEQEAIEQGIRPVVFYSREKDQAKQQKAFLGATVHLGDKTEVIPYLEPGAAMEYALSTAIKKLSIDNKPVIGFVTGHGEPSLSEMQQLTQQLGVLYQTREIQIDDSTQVSDDINTLVIIRPTDSIPSTHLAQLDKFLERGGRLLVALNSVQADLRSLYGSEFDTGLKPWLRKKGIEVLGNFVIDAQCGTVTMPEQLGPFTIQRQIAFPYVPIASTFADHAITTGLESVMLQFASELRFSGDSTKQFYPLVFSSEQSDALSAPQFFDVSRQWTENDFSRSHIALAAAIEGNPMKLVVIGDGDFPINGPPRQAREVTPDNISLVSNAIDWLSDDTGLIALRTKGAVMRPIRQLDETTRTILKYVNFLLPVVLVIGYGVYRAQKNRLIRLKRMSENFDHETK